LANNFNRGVATCLSNGFEYFAMLHTDLAAQAGWLSIMMDEMEQTDADVIHAPAAIKNHEGLTSTAIAYEDDVWSCKRRITTTELQTLPETFDISTIQHHLDADALWLLPNTGCILMRADTWLKDFPGFTIHDRIIRDGDTWSQDVVPEDWNFGYWCGRNDVSVFGTRKVVTTHYGMYPHPNNQAWGLKIDTGWQVEKENGKFTKTLTTELVI
jgi:hypothetical protein